MQRLFDAEGDVRGLAGPRRELALDLKDESAPPAHAALHALEHGAHVRAIGPVDPGALGAVRHHARDAGWLAQQHLPHAHDAVAVFECQAQRLPALRLLELAPRVCLQHVAATGALQEQAIPGGRVDAAHLLYV